MNEDKIIKEELVDWDKLILYKTIKALAKKYKVIKQNVLYNAEPIKISLLFYVKGTDVNESEPEIQWNFQPAFFEKELSNIFKNKI